MRTWRLSREAQLTVTSCFIRFILTVRVVVTLPAVRDAVTVPTAEVTGSTSLLHCGQAEINTLENKHP